jgi:TolB-like protein/DNA-binding winged helix-turn-helix (wHTH) protein/tetratricopeptide (TPR) repeat protein
VEGDFQVGQWLVQPRLNTISGNGKTAHLEPKAMQVLVYLAEHAGDVMAKERIIQAVWADTFVTDDVLTRSISELRKAFEDDPHEPRFIQTIPKGGYRLIAPVVGAGPRARPTAGAHRGAPLRKHWALAAIGGAMVAIVAATLALNIAGLRDRVLRRAMPAPKIESIAVLPLGNLSGDPEQEYLAEGMTDELITNLGKVSALRVISRQSVMRYKGSKKPLTQIARELNVDALVEGTVLRSGNRVRISANLLHAKTDRHLWAQSYERDLRDVLALQSSVARAIVDAIQVRLSPEERMRLARVQAVDPAAHEAFLRGQYYVGRSTTDRLSKSLDYFQQAIDKDPDYAEAYAWLARTHAYTGYPGMVPPQEASRKARGAVTKALELDDTLAVAHAVLGEIKATYEWDWAGAEQELRRALQLNPNDTMAHYSYMMYLSCMNRFDEAIAEARIVVALEPLSRLPLAKVYTYSRRYDDAVRELKLELEIAPESTGPHFLLNGVYTFMGRYPEAIFECEKLKKLDPGPFSTLACAATYAYAGRKIEAERALRQYMKAPYVDPWQVAGIYAGMKDQDRALAWLGKAYQERSANLCLIQFAQDMDPLRSDPRFQYLLRRMNFPQ